MKIEIEDAAGYLKTMLPDAIKARIEAVTVEYSGGISILKIDLVAEQEVLGNFRLQYQMQPAAVEEEDEDEDEDWDDDLFIDDEAPGSRVQTNPIGVAQMAAEAGATCELVLDGGRAIPCKDFQFLAPAPRPFTYARAPDVYDEDDEAPGDDFIADRVFPVVPVQKQSDLYYYLDGDLVKSPADFFPVNCRCITPAPEDSQYYAGMDMVGEPETDCDECGGRGEVELFMSTQPCSRGCAKP